MWPFDLPDQESLSIVYSLNESRVETKPSGVREKYLTDERSAFLVRQSDSSTAESSDASPKHGNERDDEKGECRPVDKGRAGLVLEDGEEGEADDERTANVALAVELER